MVKLTSTSVRYNLLLVKEKWQIKVKGLMQEACKQGSNSIVMAEEYRDVRFRLCNFLFLGADT